MAKQIILKDASLILPIPDMGAESITKSILTCMYHKPFRTLCGKWNSEENSAVWFLSQQQMTPFDSISIDETLFHEPDRARFRSVVFRLGSSASGNDGDLCGVLELKSECESKVRRFATHASFYPELGLWFMAQRLEDDSK